ncbi:glutamine synthetase family protein [Porcipelethomonas sp.]|uniref:glutamine synthetase family protein n=1 Tax=Porcipelethomonas sp. TaxID=2981675 RepID=UPI003EF5A168
MNYTPKEILSFVEENDVKFIRLTFTDIYGNLKNIAIMPDELPYAFEHGIPFDATALAGCHSDLLLFPDISTLSVLPWRPKSGRVIRFFCNIKCTDGTEYKGDLRNELTEYINTLKGQGYSCEIGTKCEFYLFNTDDNGDPTKIPHDNASYLDIAPLDKCENVRREICLSLEEMGFNPQSSRHTYGPGQNEIDFKRSDVLSAADNMVYYKTVVKNIAAQNGLFATFMPKPIENQPGSGLHISIAIKKDNEHIFSPTPENQTEIGSHFVAGILNRIREITCFLNPITNSYKRFGENFAPKYVNWSFENRSQLIRIPYTAGKHPRIEIRSADAACNPYIVFKLLLAAGFEGIDNKTVLSQKTFTGDTPAKFDELPESLREAVELAKASDFVKMNLSPEIYDAVFSNLDYTLTKYNMADDKIKFEDEFYFNSI